MVNIYVSLSKVHILIFTSVNIEAYKTVDSVTLSVESSYE